MKRYFLILALVFSFLTNCYSQVKFVPFRINGSEINQLIHTGGNTFYISVNSYLLKTTDYFSTYDTLFHYPNGACIFAVDTAYPVSPRLIVFSHDILKPQYISSDGGITWNSFGGNSTMYAFDGEKIYAANSVRILLSTTDNGITWDSKNFPDLDPLGLISSYVSLLATDENHNLYLFRSEEYYVGNEQYVESWKLYESTNNGESWITKVDKYAAPPFWYGATSNGNNLLGAMRSRGLKSFIYNTGNGQLQDLTQEGNIGRIDKQGFIYLLTDDGPPTTNKIRVSKNGLSWDSYIIDDLTMVDDFIVDEYGFFYGGYLSPYQVSYKRSEKPVHSYITQTSINFNSVTIGDTLYKRLTIYNPLYKTLSLDSIVTYNPKYFLKENSFPISIVPYDTLRIEIGFSPSAADTISTWAIIYLEKISCPVKLSGKGIITGINDPVTDNKEYKLLQNYPNPFNPATTIQYHVPKASFVTLKILNILGQEIGVLVNEMKEAGSYSTDFSNSSLPSGVYFYSIQAGSFSSVRKMILMK